MTREELNKFTKAELINAIVNTKSLYKHQIESFLNELNYNKKMKKLDDDHDRFLKATDEYKKYTDYLCQKYKTETIILSKITTDEAIKYIDLHNNWVKEANK